MATLLKRGVNEMGGAADGLLEVTVDETSFVFIKILFDSFRSNLTQSARLNCHRFAKST